MRVQVHHIGLLAVIGFLTTATLDELNEAAEGAKEVAFSRNRFGYEVNGQRLRRVTTLLNGIPKDALPAWAAREVATFAYEHREAWAGLGKTDATVSREFKKATAAKLKGFQERDLSGYDLVALVLDGKRFADDEMVVALGVTMQGDKVFLGFVQTDTENAVVIRSFLRGLKDRGLDLSAGALVVIDGARGLRSGVLAVFKGQVLIQRCQWHKRENVISYLPRAEQKSWRQRLQRAYQRPTYKEAVQDLKALRQDLAEVNQSAVASLDEGFEETLTLHRLGVFPLVGRSLKTTNAIESVNALAEQRCGRVDHWKNSGQKHRWLATTLLEIGPRLRRLLGYRHLPLLRVAIQKNLGINLPESHSHAVA